jgi:hypothetical protein
MGTLGEQDVEGAAPQGEDAGWMDTPIWTESFAERWTRYCELTYAE